ncbi:hypothetical protein VIGAN_09149000 [Vigna angularis var. angularis]|uniref:Uncharacterized protein n=1 Tax=Vigna angularis var. angularis TaxID=157739 RepID=A0A0S3SZ09_PHAAN|nr:hypothetical protein VIGAN_09149000 [Vigna angularis var. angularis]
MSLTLYLAFEVLGFNYVTESVTRELHDGSERHVIMNERQVERDQGHVELDQQEVESRRCTRIRKENSLLKGFAR